MKKRDQVAGVGEPSSEPNREPSSEPNRELSSEPTREPSASGAVATLRYIDLFCGVGGVRLGFEGACKKMNVVPVCVFSSDIEKDSAEVYMENFADDPLSDVTTVDAGGVGDFDVLLAGFPCQAFSIAGNGRGFSDTRGTLFFDIMRFVKAKKPRAVLLENVKNLIRHDGGNTLRVIEKSLIDEGYRVHLKLLCSSDFGVPQARDRVYIVALRDASGPFEFPVPEEGAATIASILERDVDESLFITRTDVVMTREPGAEPPTIRRPLQLGYVGRGGQGDRIYSTRAAGITLSAYGGGTGAKTGLYLVDGRVRRLSARECARMQGFPDSFIVHPSRRTACRHFGNSVSVPVIERLSEAILRAIVGT